ncbi:MAG: dihydroxyacetone kinase [Erysipelothrix sp.]|nr:dihydroxyacetone kinase [Erysipelothrix sp.]
MISAILVSHSPKITDGLKEMIEEMTGRHEGIKILSVGGTEDGRIGTDPVKILEVIQEESTSDYIYLYGDLGSGILSIETALDLIEDETLREKTHYISGPLVEGAFAGIIQCLVDPTPEAVKREVLSSIHLMLEEND